jgi:SagB-type dehydrogenase family enzyme
MHADDAPAGETVRRYHQATDHNEGAFDAPNEQYAGTLNPVLRPHPYKIYPSLSGIPLPTEFASSSVPALDAIAGSIPDQESGTIDLETLARLCFFTNGVTKRLRRGDRVIDFRAAPCTGALYHQEIYLVSGALPGLPAGVYQYGVHDHALYRLREGDFRAVIASAAGDADAARAPLFLVTTSVFWRNAWKYANRAYRHTYWDTGTMLPNTLAIAAANHIAARLILSFADQEVADLLDVDLDREGVIALVAFGQTGNPPPAAPPVARLDLAIEPYSSGENDYPLIRETHRSTLLSSGDAAAHWRSLEFEPGRPTPSTQLITLPNPEMLEPSDESIESLIRRRGSTRTFAQTSLTLEELSVILSRATTGFSSDVLGPDGIPFNDAYLIVNAIEGLAPGAYRYDEDRHALEPLRTMTEADARARSFRLGADQDLGGDAAFNLYFLADLDAIVATYGDRGYRLAHLGSALVSGRLYLAAYALNHGATGLTYYDGEIVDLFSPQQPSNIVTYLVAIGAPAKK